MTDPDDDVIGLVTDIGTRLTRGAIATMDSTADLMKRKPAVAEKMTFDRAFSSFIAAEVKSAGQDVANRDPLAKDLVQWERLYAARHACASEKRAAKLTGAPHEEDASWHAIGFRKLREAYEIQTKRSAVTGVRLTGQEISTRRRGLHPSYRKEIEQLQTADGYVDSKMRRKAVSMRNRVDRAAEEAETPFRPRDRSRQRQRVRGD